jgi:hypothetical protein
MPVKTSEEARRLISEWLTSRSFPINEVEHKGTIFQIESQTPSNIAFAMTQPESYRRSVFVITRVNIHEAHLKAFCSMDSKTHAEFIWELKNRLVILPPSFMFQSKSDPENIPEAIQFMKEISFDELTEGRLIEAMEQTCRGIVLVTWTFQKAFGPVEI